MKKYLKIFLIIMTVMATFTGSVFAVTANDILNMSESELMGKSVSDLQNYISILNEAKGSANFMTRQAYSLKSSYIQTIISSKTTGTESKDDWYSSYTPSNPSEYDEVTSKAGGILAIIRYIAIAISIIAITLIGIKYMIGSVEEKAEYKKKMVPFVLGLILVVGIVTIVTFIMDVTNSVLNV